jgi:hypothetical protein
MKNDTKRTDSPRADVDDKKEIKAENFERSDKSIETGQQGRTDFATGSTTQGGSDYGQGSSYLGNEAYKQGDVKNTGANYTNETGKLSEEEDDAPHGAGAHPNEKESNAKEEYPGPKKPTDEEKAQTQMEQKETDD